MINFIISIVVLLVSVFLLSVSIRYGLAGAGRLDNYFSIKSSGNFDGFQWYYRIPGSAGLIPEYYFYLVLGDDNYFKLNWWSLKTSAFLSVLVTLATLNSRRAVYDYFSLEMVRQQGFASLFTSGFFVWYLNIIVLLYLALFVLIVIESIKMHGIYAPVRILAYGLMCFLMTDLTMIVLGLIIFIALIYFVIKVIWFLFFHSRNRRRQDDSGSTTPAFLKERLRVFKKELIEWEAGNKTHHEERVKKEKPHVKIKRKRPKISRNFPDDDIPGLHPD